MRMTKGRAILPIAPSNYQRRGASSRPRDDLLDSEDWYRHQAARFRKRAARLMAKARREADEMLRTAARLEKNAQEAAQRARVAGEQPEHYEDEAGLRLPSPSRTVNSKPMLSPAHALAISKSKSKTSGAKVSPLLDAVHKKKMTLRSLCKELEERLHRPVAVSSVSMAYSGARPIDREVAEAIEKMTGFEASLKNWRGGIA
jgi:hypothetical protein